MGGSPSLPIAGRWDSSPVSPTIRQPMPDIHELTADDRACSQLLGLALWPSTKACAPAGLPAEVDVHPRVGAVADRMRLDGGRARRDPDALALPELVLAHDSPAFGTLLAGMGLRGN